MGIGFDHCLSSSPRLSSHLTYRKSVRTNEEVLSENMKEMEDMESHPRVVPRSHVAYQTLARTFGIEF